MSERARAELLDIVADEAEFLVVNKPQDLVCHPTKGDAYSSLISRARLYLGGAAFLVNRLDRETSGIVLIAKTPQVAGELGKLFEAGTVNKKYAAIVNGHITEEQGTIEARLGKDERSQIAIKDCARTDGAPARTDFVVERRFARETRPFSLLRVLPRSGRKHQIRIHLAHIGHPIVGDKLYGPDEQIYLRFVTGTISEADRASLILPNHALHAGELRFTWRGCEWAFGAEPSATFKTFLETGSPE